MMTPADLKISREALGLSQSFLAAQTNVQERQVRRWEQGVAPIPGDVAELIERLEDFSERWLETTLEAIESGVEQSSAEFGEAEGFDITAYLDDENLWAAHPDFRPLGASWHRAMLVRLLYLLEPEIAGRVSFHFGSSVD